MNRYHQRQANLYNPHSQVCFSLSRSKIDLFLECPRCFYLDRRLGLGRPSLPGFSLNTAVDVLLKKEFDLLRGQGKTHQIMKKYHVDAVPFNHPDLPEWRDDHYHFKGVCVYHSETNLEICGIIDDVWINKKKELLIVDYKSTSTNQKISLEDEYKQGYKRQMEIYQWLFRQKGFPVNNTGYFVFANAAKNRPQFDGKLEFEISLIAYQGNDDWVDPTLKKIKKCLEQNKLPAADENCEYCSYRRLIGAKIRKSTFA